MSKVTNASLFYFHDGINSSTGKVIQFDRISTSHQFECEKIFLFYNYNEKNDNNIFLQ